MTLLHTRPIVPDEPSGPPPAWSEYAVIITNDSSPVTGNPVDAKFNNVVAGDANMSYPFALSNPAGTTLDVGFVPSALPWATIETTNGSRYSGIFRAANNSQKTFRIACGEGTFDAAVSVSKNHVGASFSMRLETFANTTPVVDVLLDGNGGSWTTARAHIDGNWYSSQAAWEAAEPGARVSHTVPAGGYIDFRLTPNGGTGVCLASMALYRTA